MKLILIVAGSLLVCLGAGAWYWSWQHRTLTNAVRDAEAARLELAGQITQDQDTKQELQATVQGLLAQNADLRAAVAAAQKIAPSARPIATASLKTETVKVLGTPPSETLCVTQDGAVGPVCSQEPALPPCDGVYAEDGMGGYYCQPKKQDSGIWKVSPKPTDRAVIIPCALHTGDSGSFQVDQVVLQTDKGNRILTGTAAFWRETPPRALLAQGTFSSTLSDVDGLASPAEPRWGAEALGACTRSGCGLGLGVLFPPLKLFGVRLEARAGALAGPDLALLGGLGVRF